MAIKALIRILIPDVLLPSPHLKRLTTDKPHRPLVTSG